MRATAVLAIGVDPASGSGLEAAAAGLGLRLRVAAGLSEGLSALVEEGWLATVLSLDLAGSGLGLAERVGREERAGALVLVTDQPSAAVALEAMRIGAVDVLRAPIVGEMAERLLRGLLAEGGRIPLPDPPSEDSGPVGSSPELLEVFKSAGRVARSRAPVLVTGESGTGKELVARAIHDASDRSQRSFVAINCAALPEDLLESELFGHERGAFTGAVARKIGRFERASGGTLFLDEIGDMSLVLQAKILRALQENEIERLGGEERIQVDVRVVAATHRDLGALIEQGDFREDLYYRLAVVRLHLAPLRERGEDLRELALYYLNRFGAEYGRPLRYVSRSALARLETHTWPGNVRELRNVLERAVLVGSGDTITDDEIALDAPRTGTPAADAAQAYSPTLPMAEVERLHLTRVLATVDGHLGKAAEILGMHRNTVSRKAQEYGLRVVR